MAAEIQTFRFDEAKVREVGTTRGRAGEGHNEPELKVTLFPIDVGIPGINVRFGYDEIGDGFSSPRHRHNLDQFRYIIAGEMNIAKGVDLRQGDCGYFPEGAYYGPLTQKGPATLIGMQFPGPNGAYRINDAEKRTAMGQLKAEGGVFEGGIYTVKTSDGRTFNQDSYEAVWERHMGRPIAYATPRYPAPVIMRPDSFQWTADPTRPGVQIKHLGSFTEYGTRAALWRLRPGATIQSEYLSAPEIRYVLRGDTIYGGKPLDARSCYYIPDGRPTNPLLSLYGAELLVFTLPMYVEETWRRIQERTAA